ncbi:MULTISPECIES: hypothetical protein [unclassified Roseovarius]|uniref:hypothetical protein n=1 Tax=unclassified Roseovarius TaxID=2614913 RepID=UPI00273F23C5|nr:hypothetical protein [Roseovarius sp. MMSF_3350]
MSTNPPPKSGAKPKQSREDRLKAALKANLARRKAQARDKAAGQEGQEAGQGKKKGG